MFDVLHDRGLADYYTCDVNPGVSQRSARLRDATRFAGLDDPVVAARAVEWSNGDVARVTWTLPDMHCASCLWLIERLWRVEPGIVRSDVDLFRRTARITFRPAVVSLRQVAELLASLGYEPSLDGERGPARMPPGRRRLYLQMGVAGFAFGNIMLFSVPRYANGAPLPDAIELTFTALNLLLSAPVLFYSAQDYFLTAWQSLRRRTMTLDVPVALGLIALFGQSVVDLVTGASEGFLDSFTGLVFLLLVGKLFQQKAFDAIAFDRTFRSFFPLSVRRVAADGSRQTVPLEAVRTGDRLLVRPREVVPADAVLVDESGLVDYAFITGEERPVPVQRGDVVRAGGRAAERTFRVDVTRDVSHSQLAGLWNNPAFAQSKTNWLTDLSSRFGTWFTVIALGLAAAGVVAWWPDARMAIRVATAVLIIACPCAFTLAAPIALGTAMGVLGRAGVYLKSPAVALAMSRVDTIAFDKTGTLTSAAAGGRLDTGGLSDADLRLARSLALESLHPVSRALASTGDTSARVTSSRETPGGGISGVVDGHRVAIGSARFLAMDADAVVQADETRTGVAVDGRIRGWIAFGPAMRVGMLRLVDGLTHTYRTWLLSGDRDTSRDVWRPVFGDSMRFAQTPDDKLAMIRGEQAAGHHVLMVGDGLNDAGALAAADVGFAVSDDTATIVPACDGVVAGDTLLRLPSVLAFARATRRVIVLCLIVSVVYNAIGLSLALTGWLTPLVTAIFMPVSSLTIIGLAVGVTRWYGREVPVS